MMTLTTVNLTDTDDKKQLEGGLSPEGDNGDNKTDILLENDVKG